jgi:type I restriction enzyme S subunit
MKLSDCPSDWTLMRLSDVFEVQLGKMLSEKARGGISPKPYLRNKNVQWGSVDTTEMIEMDFNEREAEKFRLRNRDLLMCEGGVPGRTAIWRDEIAECYYQKAIHRLRPLNGQALPEFYLYWFRYAFDVTNVYGISGASSTIAHLPAAQLRALNVPVPALDEQRQIAAVLSAVQRAIERQERLIALTAELKKALMHKLFTEGTRGEPLKQTDIGSVPQSWTVAPLKQFTESFQYGTSVKCGYDVKGSPVLRIPNVVGGHLDVNDLKFGNPKRNELETVRLRSGDLLFVRTNGVRENAGRCSMYRGELGESCYFASYLIRARLRDALMPEFLEEYTRTETGVRLLSGRAARTADGKFNINTGTLETLLVPKPDTNEQKAIADALAHMDKKAHNHLGTRTTLESLFRTLLHQLMTAQIRVRDLDLAAILSSEDAKAPDDDLQFVHPSRECLQSAT